MEPSGRGAIHEWIGRDRMLLNLEMYTAMLAELAGR